MNFSSRNTNSGRNFYNVRKISRYEIYIKKNLTYVLINFIVDFYEQNFEHVCIVFERFLTYGLMKVAKSNRKTLLEGNFSKSPKKRPFA